MNLLHMYIKKIYIKLIKKNVGPKLRCHREVNCPRLCGWNSFVHKSLWHIRETNLLLWRYKQYRREKYIFISRYKSAGFGAHISTLPTRRNAALFTWGVPRAYVMDIIEFFKLLDYVVQDSLSNFVEPSIFIFN